jgi:hypothetical protein
LNGHIAPLGRHRGALRAFSTGEAAPLHSLQSATPGGDLIVICREFQPIRDVAQRVLCPRVE